MLMEGVVVDGLTEGLVDEAGLAPVVDSGPEAVVAGPIAVVISPPVVSTGAVDGPCGPVVSVPGDVVSGTKLCGEPGVMVGPMVPV